jgi:transposase
MKACATAQHWARLIGRFGPPAQRIVFQDYPHAVQNTEKRRDVLTEQIRELLAQWSMVPVVAALQALRGMAMVTAATLVAEVGDLTRFKNPRDLMSHVGLVPSEHSCGATIRRGGITKTGNSEAPGHGGSRLDLSIAGTSWSHSARPS